MAKEKIQFPGKELAGWAAGIGQAAKDRVVKAAEAMKEGGEQLRLRANELKAEKELEELCPVFPETLSSASFSYPPLICIAEADEKHLKSPVCKGSIGFLRKEDDLEILQLYPDSVGAVGITFFPSMEPAAFFVENSKEKFYVNLDDYFEYQKKERINELENIAFCLGAKHVEARLIESKKDETVVGGKADLKIPKVVKGQAAREEDHSEASRWEVALSTDFDGSDEPRRPVLHYFQNEASVLNLIAMRMGQDHKIKAKTYLWDFSHSSGIKESTAVKIESALKSMKIGLNTSLVTKAKTEKRTMLKYTIEF